MTPEARSRWVLAGLFLGATSVFGVARSLEPDPRGYGTHVKLGLPPCGMIYLTGVPCPSCGMTTSFAHAARLQVGDSFRAHPFGLALFGFMVAIGLISAVGLTGGVPPDRVERWLHSLPWWGIGIGFFGLFLLYWGYRVWRALAA